MNISIDLILVMVLFIFMLALIIKPIRLWLLDKEILISVCVALIGLVVAVWFGFSADQLSNDANKLATVSKKISENDYYFFNIESNLRKKNDYPEVVIRSGSHRTLYILIKNRKFPSVEEPIKYGIVEERDNAESSPYKVEKISLVDKKLNRDDFFLTESFYYYYVVGEGLNGEVQVNAVVYFIDNVENNTKILKNSEFFNYFSKEDLISKTSEANRQANIYFQDIRTNSKKSINEISVEFETILNKYEEMLKRIELVYD